MIKAILVDDEKHCRETLSMQLERYCPDVTLLTECSSAAEGLQAINQYNPDVVFLDVEMPGMNGFDMLKCLPAIPFALIFTTGYDTYAINAIRFSALDYLLKPIDRNDLINAVAKVQARPAPATNQQLDILMQKLEGRLTGLQKIALPTLEGFELVPLDTIIRCESDGSYTYFFVKGGRKITVSRTLKEVEELLEGHSFLRVHHSHIINLNEVQRYVRGEGGYVILSDTSSVNVSRSRKDALLKVFG
ncbi:LytTR family DNA-binding domain-containing protein [Nibrella saemangeumensis]|uniref:LytTR family DNA-binding domain-containing protein n=1 Tax=Nibrella saemangeumensis TaxID=1084526 RepID=A0ABP8MIJ0_9BACT